jgi:hypothetical protein
MEKATYGGLTTASCKLHVISLRKIKFMKLLYRDETQTRALTFILQEYQWATSYT